MASYQPILRCDFPHRHVDFVIAVRGGHRVWVPALLRWTQMGHEAGSPRGSPGRQMHHRGLFRAEQIARLASRLRAGTSLGAVMQQCPRKQVGSTEPPRKCERDRRPAGLDSPHPNAVKQRATNAQALMIGPDAHLPWALPSTSSTTT